MPFLQQIQPEEPRRLFAAGKGLAYYMEPPALAAPPFVTKIAWTADGSALLAAKLVPPASAPPLAVAAARQTEGLEGMTKLHPRAQLVAWSRAARTTRTLLDLDSARMAIREIDPMPGSDRALVRLSERTPMPDGTLSEPRSAYVLVAVGTGSAVRVYTGPEEDADTLVYLSPAKPMGAIVRGNRPAIGPNGLKRTVALFGPDGRVGTPFEVTGSFGFAADGGPGVATVEKDKSGKRFMAFHRIDSRTGAVGAVAERNGWNEEEKEPPLTVGPTQPSKTDASVLLRVAGGEADETGLVTTDGAMPLLSPKFDAVAYLSGSGAYVRNLVKVDRKAYDDALTEAEKEQAMRSAKQVGLALRMYSADADDEYPLGSQKDSVDPYLRDRSMLSAFTYTFGGGPLSKAGDPATIMIGFVGGPGGRAIVYGDGRVVWVPD